MTTLTLNAVQRLQSGCSWSASSSRRIGPEGGERRPTSPYRGSDLGGRVAVANAQRAYARYRHRFEDERWRSLRDAGANPQRLLWASTGTKNPAYSDLVNVEEPIAPDIVNTMPEATLRAFADHGEVGPLLDADASRAEETLRSAGAAGPDLAALTAELEHEGVRSFCDS